MTTHKIIDPSPAPVFDFEPEDHDHDEDDAMFDCGMTQDGFCTLAGTEWCDWHCPLICP